MLIDNDLNGVQALLSSVWPEWKVTKQLGRGSYGYVYEIIRDDLGSVHKCALKVLQMDADLNLLSGTSPGQRGQLQTDAGIKKAAQGALSNESTDGAATTVAPPSTAQKAVLEGFVQGVSTEINLMLQLRGDPHVVSIEDYAILRDPRRYTILIRMEDLACVSKRLRVRTRYDCIYLRVGRISINPFYLLSTAREQILKIHFWRHEKNPFFTFGGTKNTAKKDTPFPVCLFFILTNMFRARSRTSHAYSASEITGIAQWRIRVRQTCRSCPLTA